jgi:hypothetical protein
MKIDMKTLVTAKIGYIDEAKVDATTEEEIEQHRLEDAAEAGMDAARALLRILDRAPTEVLFRVL